MSVSIQIDCRCGTRHRDIPRAFWGHRARCHVCGRGLRVPTPSGPDSLEELFDEFARQASPAVPRDPDPLDRYQLGRLAVRTQLATRRQVEEALEVQARSKETGVIRRIGAILVQQGILEEADLRRLLALQRQKVAMLASRMVEQGRLGSDALRKVEIDLALGIEMPTPDPERAFDPVSAVDPRVESLELPAIEIALPSEPARPIPAEDAQRPVPLRTRADDIRLVVKRDLRRRTSLASRGSRATFYAVTGIVLLGAALVLGAFLSVRASRPQRARETPAVPAGSQAEALRRVPVHG